VERIIPPHLSLTLQRIHGHDIQQSPKVELSKCATSFWMAPPRSGASDAENTTMGSFQSPKSQLTYEITPYLELWRNTEHDIPVEAREHRVTTIDQIRAIHPHKLREYLYEHWNSKQQHDTCSQLHPVSHDHV
jgi:hypothetical protein